MPRIRHDPARPKPIVAASAKATVMPASNDNHVHSIPIKNVMTPHDAKDPTPTAASPVIKPRTPYVTDAIFEVSAHRARLIKTTHREEQLLTGREFLPSGEMSPLGCRTQATDTCVT